MQSSPTPEIAAEAAEKRTPAHSTLVSRNVTIAGHRTSVRLEPEMWSGLSEICRRERANIHEICTSISMRKHENTSLTAAIRVFAMAYFRVAATEDGHLKAGHGHNSAMFAIGPGGATPMARMGGSAPSSTPSSGSSYPMLGGKMDGIRRL